MPDDEYAATLERHAADIRALLSQRRGRPRDPELRKLLARLFVACEEAVRLEQQNALTPAAKVRLEAQLEGDPAALSLDSALEVVDTVDQILISQGDATYLCKQVAAEYGRAPGSTTVVTWRTLYGPEKPAALKAFESGAPVAELELSQGRNRLAALRHRRSDVYRLQRTRMRLKAQHLWMLAPVLLLLVVTMGIALGARGERPAQIVLAASAGAVGATLSGLFKLRDQIEHISALRAFTPAIVVQPIVGAASALFVGLVLDAGLLDVGKGAGAAWPALGFAAGFSEPMLLGIVGRVAAIGEQQEPEETAPETQTVPA
jgi:hypothetical protein